MKKVLIFALFLFTSLSLAAQWNTNYLLRKGQGAMFLDDHISAIGNFNHIIRVKPYLSEPYFFRGMAKFNLDDYNGAIQDFTQAIELDISYAHAYAYRGMSLHRLNRYDEAMRDFNMAISINPREAYIYANRAITETEMGDFKAAEQDYSRALIIDNKLLAAYLNRAILRERMEDIEGALADCTAAIRLNTLSDEALGLRGYLQYEQKRYLDAISDFDQALRINPENKQVLMSRAIVLYEQKKYPEALADYTRVIELDSSYIFAYYNRGLLRAEIGDINRAIEDMDEVLRMNHDNILIWFNRGLLKMEIRDWRGAYDDFSESIYLFPDFVRAYQARAAVSRQQGDLNAAERDYRQAEEIMNRYQRMQAGDRSALVDTTENFRRLVDINSRNDRMKEVINGRLQDKHVIVELEEPFWVQYLPLDTLRKGKIRYYNKHITTFNQSRDYNPAIMISNRTFIYPKDFVDEQVGVLTERLEKDRRDKDALLLRGGFYLFRNEYTRAISDFQALLELEPDHLLARLNLAAARMKMYDYIAAIEERAVRMSDGQREERQQTDYSQVLKDLEKCLEQDPDFVFALFNIANVYAKTGEIDQAIAYYTRVLEKDSLLAEAYFNRGVLYIYQGNKEQANQDLSKAGELGLTDSYSIIKRYCFE